jgi:hypothetical protein
MVLISFEKSFSFWFGFALFIILFLAWLCRLTKKAEPPPTCGVNRDSGTDSANGGWLRRLVRHHGQHK